VVRALDSPLNRSRGRTSKGRGWERKGEEERGEEGRGGKEFSALGIKKNSAPVVQSLGCSE